MAEHFSELPLFPLNTVLFPRQALPLHVFENRYLIMIEECLAGSGLLGVARIKSGMEVGGPAEPFEIGTSAHITGVQRRPDGKLDVGIEGVRRFHLHEIVQQRPYLIGRVEWLEEELDGEQLNGVLGPVTARVQDCMRKLLALNNEWARNIPVPSEPAELSFLIAERLQVGLDEKQRLLEAPTVAERLRLELPLLEAEKARLTQVLMHREWMDRGRQN